MKIYYGLVVQDGDWWMITIPELDGLTQARTIDEASVMAREYIAVTTGESLENTEVALTLPPPA